MKIIAFNAQISTHVESNKEHEKTLSGKRTILPQQQVLFSFK